jgi:small-conductance mechanosensitive channel
LFCWFALKITEEDNIYSGSSLEVHTFIHPIVHCFGFISKYHRIKTLEYVKLSDGTEGTITAIGLLETEIVGDDFVPVRVPNTMIIGKKVALYSKVTKSQVHQVLRFKYADLDKIPQLLLDIAQAIEARCQPDENDVNEVVLDKPPSVTLMKYEADHIQVECTVEFDLKPTSSEFVQMREQVLFAIADATKRNGVQFAIPAIQYENTRRTTSSNNNNQYRDGDEYDGEAYHDDGEDGDHFLAS